MQEPISIPQAYRAMFVFIKNYYERKGKPAELGILLSDIQLMSHLYPLREENDSIRLETADPASWHDWLEAVNTILDEDKN
ncbi:MAG: hypothetical protein WAS33_03415 [Candidatus Promineifilaceae bacterium]|nr:hypothetical protein [Anaerolineaceae bacterium]